MTSNYVLLQMNQVKIKVITKIQHTILKGNIKHTWNCYAVTDNSATVFIRTNEQ